MADQIYTVDSYWRYGPGNPFSRPPGVERVSGLDRVRSSVFDPIGHIREFLEKLTSIQNTIDAMARYDALRGIEEQLLPGQSVDVTLVRRGQADYIVERIDAPHTAPRAWLSAPAVEQSSGSDGPREVVAVSRALSPTDLCHAPGQEPRRTEFMVSGKTLGGVDTMRLGEGENRTPVRLDHSLSDLLLPVERSHRGQPLQQNSDAPPVYNSRTREHEKMIVRPMGLP